MRMNFLNLAVLLNNLCPGLYSRLKVILTVGMWGRDGVTR